MAPGLLIFQKKPEIPMLYMKVSAFKSWHLIQNLKSSEQTTAMQVCAAGVLPRGG